MRFTKFRVVYLAAFLLWAIVPAFNANVFAEAKVMKNESGLRYTDDTTGSGDLASSGKLVTVHYTGWLLGANDAQGDKFDSSKDHGAPFSFRLGAEKSLRDGMKGLLA